MGEGVWVGEANQALLTDLYQLTMAQGYWHQKMDDDAVFTLFVRRLPSNRNYLLACGLADVLHYLERLRFSDPAIEYLSSLPEFEPEFLHWLSALRFTGDVYAVPEGTPVFANEPILEVVAPIAEAQVIETFVMNQIHLQTVLASKAARVVEAAQGRPVVDFGLRRMHGADAGLKSARAFYIAGVAATSNVLAGHVYGVPVRGTMGHSYIQAHEHEIDAFRAFVQLDPATVLLVDTYDTLRGVENVIELAREMGDRFQVRAIRLDSGDLATLAHQARHMLDAAGLERVGIFASGGLDEYEIVDILSKHAPIDAFGVGTGMGVSRDAPALDMAYKLADYAGRGRLKKSPGKPILPGRKQVFRETRDGRAVGDLIGRWEETLSGTPLLRQVMRSGRRVEGASDTVETARARARLELLRLPEEIRAVDPALTPYPVAVSEALREYQNQVAATVE